MSRAARSAAQEHAPPRRVSAQHDHHEREAERAAETVVRGGSVAGWSFSDVPSRAPAPVQRQGAAPKEKSEDEKTKEALKKAGEAALATPQGKALKEKVLQDPLVKSVTDAVTSTPGLIATGAALAGGVGALAATGKELPIQPPEIPLEKLSPKLAGVSAQVTYEGPVNAPTFVGLTITVKEQGKKGKGAKPDPIATETARLRAQDEMFKRGRTYAPGSKEAEEERLLDQAVTDYVVRSSRLPGITIPLVAPKAPKKEEEPTPARPAPASPSAAPPAHAHVDDALSSPGRPLPPPTRRAMEARFGHDFSRVRIHDDTRAAATAESIDAAAFTVGEDIAFATGRYEPASPEGRRLLAHELAHVVQQSFAACGRGVVQRLGAGEFFSRLFGEGTFDEEELRVYLEGRDSGEIEDHFDSDNKARAIVRQWRTGGSRWVLTARRKSVLVREMLSGAVFDEDEKMILELLVRSYNAELRYIFSTGQVSPNSVDGALHGLEQRRLTAFFENRFEGGREAVLRGEIKPRGDSVPLGDDIEQLDELIPPEVPGAVREWSVPCVLGIFCTLAPEVVSALRGVKVVRFAFMNVDRWTYDGTAWTKETAHPVGFEQNEGGEHTVGVKRQRECADVAQTFKHEVVHRKQTQGTRYERELEAYTEAERFAISYGLPGRPRLRRTTPSGEVEPDPARIGAYVRRRYGGPEAGAPEDVLVGHKEDGTAIVRRPDGSTYERLPAEGDVYLDEHPTLIGDETIPPLSWRCPPRGGP